MQALAALRGYYKKQKEHTRIQGQPYIYHKIAGALKKMAGWLNRYDDVGAHRLKRKLLELTEDFETDVEVTDYE